MWHIDYYLDDIPWERDYTHMVFQNVVVTDSSNGTLVMQSPGTWSQVEDFVDACTGNDVLPIICLHGSEDLHQVLLYDRSDLISSIHDVISSYGLAGIAIDWEGHDEQTVLYDTFLTELRTNFDQTWEHKIITPVGKLSTINVPFSAENEIDWVSVQCYDYDQIPSGGAMDTVISTMSTWHNAGFPKSKLDMSYPVFGTYGAGTTGWAAYNEIIEDLESPPWQNSGYYDSPEYGIQFYYWNGQYMVMDKTEWVINNGYGGIWSYEIGTDKLMDGDNPDYYYCLDYGVWKVRNPSFTAPSVSTSSATSITSTSAILNGNLTNLGSSGAGFLVGVEFEWGTMSGNYPNDSSFLERSTTGTYSINVSNLAPNTTYYFRAKAYGDGIGYGSEFYFTTSS